MMIGVTMTTTPTPGRVHLPGTMSALKTLCTTTAQPGDVIDLRGMTFDDNGTLQITRSGVYGRPITLVNGRVQRAPGGPTANITGHHWRFQNVTFVDGSKVVNVRGQYHTFARCSFMQSGDELVKCYAGSGNVTFEHCLWDTAGLVQPDIGEALYLGEHPGSALVEVSGFRVIGGVMRGFTAEGIDIKEGCTNVLIRDLYIDASTQDGAQFAGYAGIACKSTGATVLDTTIINPRVAGLVILNSANTGLWNAPPSGHIDGLRVSRADGRADFVIEDRGTASEFSYGENGWIGE